MSAYYADQNETEGKLPQLRPMLQHIINERILVLDGAMGSSIQRYRLTEADFVGQSGCTLPQQGNNDLLNITRPDIIREIHHRYLAAGADIISTNTFNAQRISQSDYGCEHLVSQMNRSAAQLARSEADAFTRQQPSKPRFVAGSVGPTNKTASLSADVEDPASRPVTFDQLAEAYAEQILALIEGGVDMLLVETIFDTLNAKAALYAAQQLFNQGVRRVPVMLSVSLSDKAGRTLSGQTLQAFVTSVAQHDCVMSIGLNCSLGATDLLPFLREMSADAPCFVSCHPNAGLPNALGQYDQTPEQMTKEVQRFIDEGLVNIIGGCCGTNHEHIAHIASLVVGAEPRRLPESSRMMQLAGLERLTLTPEVHFVNVGERCNVAGSRKFLRLIKEKNYDEAISIARKQVEDGALVLDINLDDGLLNAEQEMVHFVNLLASEPDIARIPLMIDSSKWEVVQAALKCCQGKCVVNSISLKEGEEIFLQHAKEIRNYCAAIVVMAFDEEGQADTYERRIAICERAYHLLTERVGFPPEDIIFDPNVLAICTGMAQHQTYALDFIRATAWIRQHLPYAHISGGVSNLSFSFRGNNYLREAMHAVFLYHAINQGMDIGIVNPSSSVLYSDIDKALLLLIEDVILNPSEAAEEALLAKAEEMMIELQHQKDNKVAGVAETAPTVQAWRNSPLEERLAHALIKGTSEYLAADLDEALLCYGKAVDIIEGPLMSAMEQVGKLFGAGKMFLPQVVKTARTMKTAVSILQPHIEHQKIQNTERENSIHGNGVFVMATVKGDVHDIGKNIVSVVLSCNNYEVHDLGVMVSAQAIVEAVKTYHADFVGLSGLITPSLDEMINTAKVLKAEGINIPILLGGATTSRLHTALKIAPVYDGPVVWVRDASQMVLVAANLRNPMTRDAYLKKIYKEYADIVAQTTDKPSPALRNIEEARANKLQLFEQ